MSAISSDSDPSEQGYSSLEKLPGEMVSAIAQSLSCDDILSLRLTSKKIHDEMDFEMKWVMKDRCPRTKMTLRGISRLKWLGERRIAKHVQHLDLQRPLPWHFAEDSDTAVEDDSLLKRPRGDSLDKLGLSPDEASKFCKDRFAEVATTALCGFENLETISIQLNDLGSPVLRPDEIAREFPWCFEALSFLRSGLQKPVDFSIKSREFICYISPPRIHDQVTYETYFDRRWYDWEEDKYEPVVIEGLSTTFAIFWKCIRGTILNQCPSNIRLSNVFLQQSDVYRMYWPTDAPEVLSLEGVVEIEYDDGEDSEREDPASRARLHALQALVSHPKHNLRDLSVVKCNNYSKPASWIPFFEVLKNHKNLQSFRFEDNKDVSFDWDGDSEMDNGSRLQEFIEELGMEKALDKMIRAYRNTNAFVLHGF